MRSQHTVVQILGVVFGLQLGRWAEAGVAARVWGLFGALTAMHIIANFLALGCLRLRTLSSIRLSLVIQVRSPPKPQNVFDSKIASREILLTRTPE